VPGRRRQFTAQLARPLSCRDRFKLRRVVGRQPQRLGEQRHRVPVRRTPVAAFERADADGTHFGPLSKRILGQPGGQSMAPQERTEFRNRYAFFLHGHTPAASGDVANAATV